VAEIIVLVSTQMHSVGKLIPPDHGLLGHDQVISKTLKLQRPPLKEGIVRRVCTETVPDYGG